MSQTTHDLLTARGNAVDLSESDRHRLLEVDRRRHVLAALAERSRPFSLDEMAAAVADREVGVDPEDAEAVADVATTLHHVHLPKMADVGVLDYDATTNRITP